MADKGGILGAGGDLLSFAGNAIIPETMDRFRKINERKERNSLMESLLGNFGGAPASTSSGYHGDDASAYGPTTQNPASGGVDLRPWRKAHPDTDVFDINFINGLVGNTLPKAPLRGKDRYMDTKRGVFDLQNTSIVPGTEVDPDDLTAWQKQQLEKQDRQFELQERRLNAADARAEATEARRNRPTATGYVSRSTGNPLQYNAGMGVYTDEGNVVSPMDLVPASDFNKSIDAARNLVAGTQRAYDLKKTVEDNKSAFDASKVNSARGLRWVPGIGDQMAASVFTPEENKIRADVARDAAQIIHELYGAALSMGEQGRAQGFTPGENDTLEMLLPKLQSAIEWAEKQEKALLPGAVTRARYQLGVAAKPAGRPAGVPDNAKQASDGKWYAPDPARPGKYLMFGGQ